MGFINRIFLFEIANNSTAILLFLIVILLILDMKKGTLFTQNAHIQKVRAYINMYELTIYIIT